MVASKEAKFISNIIFEVSLTDEPKDDVSSGVGVLFGALNLGAKENSETQQSSLSKIKFNIPIDLK
jgi:hypothetical protein